jgi:hypothetical protein
MRRVRKELTQTEIDTQKYMKARQAEYRQARFINNEDKRDAQIWLSRHSRVRALSESMTVLSRVMHVALTAQNALNLAQLVFAQKSSVTLEASRNVRQAKRELQLALANGGSAQQIADLQEEISIAEAKLKELDDQAKADNMSNIIQLVTTFTFLGSSIGSIVTKAPQLIGILRRLGGRGGGGLGGALGSSGSVAGGGSGGGMGSGGGIVGSTGSVGGRCMSMCQETVSRLGGAMAGALATALPVALGIGAGLLIPQLLPLLTPGGKPPGGEKVDLTPKGLAPLPGMPKQLEQIVDNTKKVKDTTGKVRNLYDDLWAAQWAAKGTVINTTEAAKSTAKQFNVNLSESLRVADSSGQKTAGSWLNLAGTSAAIAVTGLTIATVIEQFKANIVQAVARFGAVAQSLPNSFAIGMDHFGAQKAYASSGGSGSKTSTISAASRTAINAKPNALGLKLAAGGSFIAGSPQYIKVGEAGAERVDVTPLGSRGGSGGGGTVVNNFNIAGSVWSTDELLAVIDAHRKRALRSRNIGV